MKIKFTRPGGAQREYSVRAVDGGSILKPESVYDVPAEIAAVLIAQGDFSAVVDAEPEPAPVAHKPERGAK